VNPTGVDGPEALVGVFEDGDGTFLPLRLHHLGERLPKNAAHDHVPRGEVRFVAFELPTNADESVDPDRENHAQEEPSNQSYREPHDLRGTPYALRAPTPTRANKTPLGCTG
jgi:hypothetical protein